MKRLFFGCMVVVALTLGGCGDSSNTPTYTAQILSDATADGDIASAAGTGTLTITQGNTLQVFAGFNPAGGSEFRTFLDFPLDGVNNGVPVDAAIASATLNFYINSITPSPLPFPGTIPIRIDLVSFQAQTLVGADFNSTALASITINPPISLADVSGFVPVDVTPLMREAQRLRLADFQVRIQRDNGTASGMIEINDIIGANRNSFAPQLDVVYY
jgi:hypothetical protein